MMQVTERLAAELSGSKSTKTEAEKVADEVRKVKAPKFMTPAIRAKAMKMMEAEDFTDADAMHFIALHDYLHEQIYGLPDPDTQGPALRVVRTQCEGMLRALGSKLMLEFIRWAWIEERRRETWRRENHADGGRLGARVLFTRSKLTEYKISNARRQKAM